MFRKLFRRRQADSELNEELRFYLDQETQLRIERGESPEQARAAARRDFGSLALVQETTRRVWGWTLLEDLAHDLRFGARLLLRAPLPAAAAIASLALGIGANTAIFSLMDLVMLRSLPVREPHRLVQLQKLHADSSRGGLSYPMYDDLRRGLRSFDAVVAQSDIQPREVLIEGRQETVKAQLVSDNYFDTLGLEAQPGRVFLAENPVPVAVIGHRFWRRRFASDPAVLGKSFQLGKASFTIIGVTPPEFFGTIAGEIPDIFVPLSADGAIRGGKSWIAERGISWLSVLARLRPGATLDQARAECAAVFPRVLDAHKDLRAGRARDNFLAQRLAVYPAAGGFDDLRRRFSEPLAILMGVVALVLLIACANIANLLLARSAARAREISVRLAIGAGRGRIVRQLLAEGLLLAAIGGSFGLLLAVGFGNWLIGMMSNGGERIALEVQPDLRVLAFASAVSLGACLLFSLAPAFHAVRADVRAPRWTLGRGLIVAQVAISLLLLVGAGLFGRTLYNMYAQDAGFDGKGILTFRLSGGADAATLTKLRAIPGVLSASYVRFTPMSGVIWDSSLTIDGYTHGPQESNESAMNAVGSDYFRTLATPLLAGREFDDHDTPASKPVATVNESFARYYFKDASPLGRWVMRSTAKFEIVGVVKDAKYRNLRLAAPRTVYIASAQQPGGFASNYLLVRVAPAAPATFRSIEAAVQPLRLLEPLTMSDLMARSLLQERMLATLAGGFGALAVLLAAVGIYGVMAFQVARRRKEIGIRVALGAGPREVTGLLVGQTARLVLFGAAIGIPGALALTRLAAKTLYGVAPADPATFAGSVLMLAAVALGAAWLPGRGATRIDPVHSLRCD